MAIIANSRRTETGIPIIFSNWIKIIPKKNADNNAPKLSTRNMAFGVVLFRKSSRFLNVLIPNVLDDIDPLFIGYIF